MRFRLIYIVLLLLLSLPLASSFAEQFDATNVEDAIKRAKDYEQRTDVPQIRNSEAQEAAKQAAKTFYSPQCQERIQGEIERLKVDQFSDILKDYQQTGKMAQPGQSALLPDERIYIFISSSVPLPVLRTYASVLDRLNDANVSMVMRGFVDGMKLFRPTLDFVRSVIVKDPGCDLATEQCEAYNATINIDPLLFSRYGVQNVPAIAHAKGVTLVDPGMSEGDPNNTTALQDAYILYGDVSFEYAVEVLSRETKNPRLYNLLKGNAFYGQQSK